MSDYPLMAQRVFLTSVVGILLKMAYIDHAVESAVGFCNI